MSFKDDEIFDSAGIARQGWSFPQTGHGLPNCRFTKLQFDQTVPHDDSFHNRRRGGLELEIAEAIVDAHDGTILCESTKGAGSKFTVSFDVKESWTDHQLLSGAR